MKRIRAFFSNPIFSKVGPILVLALLLGFTWVLRSGVLEPPKKKIMLIGVDCLDWDILNPLLERGQCPNLSRLIENGTSGILMSEGETISPVIWTSIATGQPREVHGVVNFFRMDGNKPVLAGPEMERIPVTSADRKVPALWNILTMEEKDVACLGWWATWPAEEINGSMVSGFSTYSDKAYVSRGVHAGENVAHLTYPETLNENIQDLMIDVDTVTHEDLDRFLDVDNWNSPIFLKEEMNRGVEYTLPWSYATDTSYINISEYLLDRNEYDLVMTYIQGTDTCSHRFWEFREDQHALSSILHDYDLYPELEGDYRKYFSKALDNYYIYTDALIGRLLKYVDKNTVVILCSDHGFGTFTEETRGPNTMFSGTHRLEGVVIMSGRGIRKGAKLNDDTPPTIFDITPTILALLELPLAEDMPGMPIFDAFDANLRSDYTPIYVKSYNVNFRAGEMPKTVPMDAEYEERLRSLGYIQ